MPKEKDAFLSCLFEDQLVRIKPTNLDECFRRAKQAIVNPINHLDGYFERAKQAILPSLQREQFHPLSPYPLSSFNALSVPQSSSPLQLYHQQGQGQRQPLHNQLFSHTFSPATFQSIPTPPRLTEGQEEIAISIGRRKIFTTLFSTGESNHQQPLETTEPLALSTPPSQQGEEQKRPLHTISDDNTKTQSTLNPNKRKEPDTAVTKFFSTKKLKPESPSSSEEKQQPKTPKKNTNSVTTSSFKI